MAPMDRRRFLAVTAATAGSLKTFAQGVTETTALPVTKLTLHTDQPGPTVPYNFVGLSYEMEQITVPDFFAPQNEEVIAQFRALGPQGILRLGGNSSDFGYWKPTPDAPMPERLPAHPFGSVNRPDTPFPVTPESLHRLRGFLDATNWSCIYGINMGTNVPRVAAEEAAAATKILGPQLECLQIGNEADRFGITPRGLPNFSGDSKPIPESGFLSAWSKPTEVLRH